MTGTSSVTANRIALVTGGGSGMGRASCLRLAREGRAVAVLDIDESGANETAQAIHEAGGKALAVAADVTQRDQVARAVAEVHAELGAIGILVNSAGMEHFSPFDTIDRDDWQRMLDVNLTGNFNVTQAVTPDMVSGGWGRIVNFTSISAQTGAANMVHYASAKGGIIAMTRSLAQALGPRGVTVNAIAPGLIDTPMARRAIDGGQFSLAVEQLVAHYPIPRMGTPEEAAAAVAFFASEDAGYITGQLLGVNGGTAA